MYRIKDIVRIRRIGLDVLNLTVNRRNAGHSKWTNIKHIKAAKDAQKSLTFQKTAQLIRLAVQEGGGPDPKLNAQLSSIIAQAKKSNMPLASIQSAMKQDKDTKSSTKAYYFEVRGPGGCTIILSTLTDNRNRMKVMLNTYVKKYNSTFTEGAIPGLFDHKGFIEAIPHKKTPLETAVEHAIEAGAEDVVELDDAEDSALQFVCSPTALNQVRGKLEKLQYTIRAADCEFIPKMQVTLNDADLDVVKKLCDKLTEMPDVVRLYDNIA